MELEAGERKTAITNSLNKEIQRQIDANAESKKREAERIAAMEAENKRLEELVGELQDAEKLDPNRDHGGISHDSGMRINKVR
ncbi:hypothetical protein HGG76_02495 [Ochrobactrum tritici]|uniref:Uncharacterized protein n=1 Tax=Brucella tritici TaxID=94626 RepID=A0A7X6J9T5_9HYPH|nr:hypothetical protein [Brucella tritici]